MSARLTRAQYEAVLAQAQRIYACSSAEDFPRHAVQIVSTLVAGHHVSFQRIAPTVPEIWAVFEPNLPDEGWMWQVFDECRHEHPTLQHRLRTGDPTGYKISDFVGPGQWHRTGLYQRLFRNIETEDQMAFTLESSGTGFHAMVFFRDQQTFTERERIILNLLRPHIAQAYQHARTLQRLKRVQTQWGEVAEAFGLCVMTVGRMGRIIDADDDANTLLKQFFDAKGAAAHLPHPVLDWLKNNWPASQNAPRELRDRRLPLVLRKGGQTLLVRALPADNSDPDKAVLLMEHRTLEQRAPQLQAQGLTKREIELLAHAEQGKTNDEIAAGLGISPKTVRKHLEHIFDKLDVNTRTAAIAKARNDIPLS